VMALRAALQREAVRGSIGMVVLDYLQLMQSVSRRSDNRVNELADISRGLKVLALEMKCPFIVLSQLNRDSVKAKREPELYDLRDCGALEQDADVVMFPYTPRPDPSVSILEVEPLLKKQRSGPTGSIALKFTQEYTLFEEPRAA
jgi:replicative DNA helicase